MSDHPVSTTNADVVDRLARLRTILPLIASDLAAARRRSATLETENRRLQQRITELEARLATTDAGTAPRRHRIEAALPR